MARARNIKPALFKNEVLGEADPLLTILFQGLWCLADRDGKLEDRPKRIKAEIFPYRELPDFNGYLTELERLGFIERYEAENTEVIRVINFSKHQSPHKTERSSDLPDRPENTGAETLTVNAPLKDESVTDEAALIPDSLNTDSLLKPSCPVGEGKEISDRVILALNDQAGKRFRLTDNNRRPILARLRDGFTESDCLAVIANRVAKWRGTEQDEYLRPETLFRPKNFESYLNDNGGRIEQAQDSSSTRGRTLKEDLTDTSWAH